MDITIMFKKVYVEITNNCNLDCNFCIGNKRDKKFISIDEFNTVLDKGTLDCILCGDNSVPNAAKMMSEVFRILAPGGHYLVITYGDPEVRKKYLETQPWSSLSVDKLAKPSAAVSSTINADENDLKNFHYIYTMTKAK